ncbi:transforming growth factor-beta receptor-associated protein 1 [Gadus macrocephalus]|uniref:transforming growth factor-beta receptor-associated protein 1 n=1 Tax=Gadus macrocephalus TaxID=80720 RepID=UPI0028CB70B9|nr:transforming growth factor-beta receptor-associated protein 1 [Gadus macrocephalus]
MAAIAFTQTHIYTKQAGPKDKDKYCIQCLECSDRNIYVGTRDSTVQHLTLDQTQAQAQAKAQAQAQAQARECRTRKLGPSSPIKQLRSVPLLNHLLVLWEQCVAALDMFSLEPVPGLKAIQHSSCMEVCGRRPSSPSSSTPRTPCRREGDSVGLITASSRRKLVRIHAVWVDRWEVLREVPLPQDPVSLAVDGSCVCIATVDRYHLVDYHAGSMLELFPHDRGRRQGAMVVPTGGGEFLLDAPGSLGMFVMSTGTCQRPPLPWPREVLAAAVCFPYVLALQPRGLSVYSLLDHTLKQTVALDGARGLVPGPEGVLVFTDRQIWALSLVPLREQVQALVICQRLDEALFLLDGVQSHLPQHSYEELHKDISYLAGMHQFNQRAFDAAKELFIAGDLDPREIISLYPDMRPCLGDQGLVSRRGETTVGQEEVADLARLQREDAAAYRLYLDFLADYLAVVRATGRGGPREAVDCALLRVYAEQGAAGEGGSLRQLVASPNACRLDRCVSVLEHHNRYFVLGMLYQSHGNHVKAIKTWVKIADGHFEDPSCPDVYEHIVSTLTTQDIDVVWIFAEWALQKNQEVGVRIFTKHQQENNDQNTFGAEEILKFLQNYPQASLFYLEFLMNKEKSETEGYHTDLALAYVNQTLQAFSGQGEPPEAGETRAKLQELLWSSMSYDVPAVHQRIMATGLHVERAIVLGRSGDHTQALRVLVHEGREPHAAQAYCHRAAQERSHASGPGDAAGLRRTLLLTLLSMYLCSDALAGEALELLGDNALHFPPGRVLELLPGAWSVGLVCRYLVGSLRETLHRRRMGGLQRALAQAEYLRHKVLWTQASKTMVRVHKGQKCQACQKELTEAFIRTVGGQLLHTSCNTQSH